MAENPTTASLGEAIRERRLALGLSQEALAERVAAAGDPAFRQSDVSRLEKGRVELPRNARLRCLAAALEVSPGALLARSGWAADGATLDARGENPAPTLAPVSADVLVVNDEPVEAEALAGLLTDEGWSVQVAPSAAAALAALAGDAPPVVVADTGLPSDGAAAIARVLADRGAPARLVLLGAAPGETRPGAVPRPVQAAELLRAVRHALESPSEPPRARQALPSPHVARSP